MEHSTVPVTSLSSLPLRWTAARIKGVPTKRRTAEVEFFGDFSDPWCYLTFRRLGRAADATASTVDTSIRWRPHVPKRYEPAASGCREITAFVSSLGDAEGVEFAPRVATVDTLDANRLVRLAEQLRDPRGITERVIDRLFRANLCEGHDISERSVLVSLAAEAGLDRHQTASWLAGEAGIGEHEAERRAIDTVPFMLVNGRLGLKGMQSVGKLIGVIQGASWFGNRGRHRPN